MDYDLPIDIVLKMKRRVISAKVSDMHEATVGKMGDMIRKAEVLVENQSRVGTYTTVRIYIISWG